MARITNWRDEPIEVAQSGGGVRAVVNPWDNVISTGIRPWPTPELIQKVYQSRQVRAFSGTEEQLATAALGFYSDLQSIHSEDAITWSVFGPVIYAGALAREAFVADLFKTIMVPATARNAYIWLWRRLPSSGHARTWWARDRLRRADRRCVPPRRGQMAFLGWCGTRGQPR
jgi:hypothetical protein